MVAIKRLLVFEVLLTISINDMAFARENKNTTNKHQNGRDSVSTYGSRDKHNKTPKKSFLVLETESLTFD